MKHFKSMAYPIYTAVLAVLAVLSLLRTEWWPLMIATVFVTHFPAVLKISDQRKIFGSFKILRGFDEIPAMTFMVFGWIICSAQVGFGVIPLMVLTVTAIAGCYLATRWSGKFSISPTEISSFSTPKTPENLSVRGQQAGYVLRCCLVLTSAGAICGSILGLATWTQTALGVLSITALVVVSAWVVSLRWTRQRLQPSLKAAQINVVRAELAKLRPEIVIYYSSPNVTNSKAIETAITQVAETDRPYFVLVREARVFAMCLKAGIKNLVLAERIETLDHFKTDSLKLAVYINDAEKNGHFIRFNDLHHVNILPASSANWNTLASNYNMYDSLLARTIAARDAIRTDVSPELGAKLTYLSTTEKSSDVPILPAYPLRAIDGTVSIGWTMDAPQFEDHRDWLLTERAAEHVFSAVSQSTNPPLRLFVTPATKQNRDRNYEAVIDRLQEFAEALNHQTSFMDPSNRTPRIQFQSASIENGYNRSDVAMCCDYTHIADLRASGKPIVFFDAMGHTSDIPEDLYVLKHDLSNLAPLLAQITGPDPKAALRHIAAQQSVAECGLSPEGGVSCLADLLLALLDQQANTISEIPQTSEIAA